jgi:hypothetical protein
VPSPNSKAASSAAAMPFHVLEKSATGSTWTKVPGISRMVCVRGCQRWSLTHPPLPGYGATRRRRGAVLPHRAQGRQHGHLCRGEGVKTREREDGKTKTLIVEYGGQAPAPGPFGETPKGTRETRVLPEDEWGKKTKALGDQCPLGV